MASHDENSEMLLGYLTSHDKVIKRNVFSNKEKQLFLHIYPLKAFHILYLDTFLLFPM